jgi:ribosome-associated toxin RatA of RatAB toxin-antitoxin module
MQTISRSALVPYTNAQMYDLVNDIKSYPDFLPWCRRSRVISEDEDEIRAELELAKGSLHKTFATCNRLQHHKMIEMRLLEGPFKHLEGFWRFTSLDETSSKVSLDMEFEFKNRILTMTVGPMFNQIANSLVDAFTQRARQIYG